VSGEIDLPSTQTTAATGQCNEFELVAVDNTVESSAVHNSGDVQCDLWEFGDYPVVASCDEKGPRVNSVISTRGVKNFTTAICGCASGGTQIYCPVRFRMPDSYSKSWRDCHDRVV